MGHGYDSGCGLRRKLRGITNYELRITNEELITDLLITDLLITDLLITDLLITDLLITDPLIY